MFESLFAGLLSLALNTSQQIQTQPATFVQSAYIEKIDCEEGSGTGFKLADGRWVTARHVSKLTNCLVDGLPILVTYSDDWGDISTFVVPGDKRKGGYQVDCDGFLDRHWYSAQGHAEGLPVITAVNIMYAELAQWAGKDRGWSVLVYNRVIPGQSGGPILDSLSGKVVGVVNAFGIFFPISFSRELKRTVVCGA